MKNTLKIIILSLISAILFCSSCSSPDKKEEAKVSHIPLEVFEQEVINKLYDKLGEFEVTETEGQVIYSAANLRYTVEISPDKYVKSVSAITESVDAEFVMKVTPYDLEKMDSMLSPEKTESINAVRYGAMPLPCFCGLRGWDALDVALDARSREVKENGWKVTYSAEGSSARYDIVYVG